jgi:GntR family transcriptional regulator, transcriptional repressor for pyruvate dehydrogenase complex
MNMAAARNLPSEPLRPGLPIDYTGVQEEQSARGRGPVDEDTRQLKTSERVAYELVRGIVTTGLHVGDRLPDEATMLSQHRVSRESLREALRLLEVQGLITIHRGPGGGPRVAGVDPAHLARSASLYFHLSGATYDEVLETWLTIEPAVAEKVAGLPDRARVRETLEPFIDEDRTAAEPHGLATTTGFHATLAELGGNRVLGLVQQAVAHIVVDHVMLALDPVQDAETIERHHRALAVAIAAGHTHKARTLMAEHVGTVVETYRARSPKRLHEIVEWR